jgi:hypothetical protein
MLCILFVDIFYPKIVDDQAETDRAGVVLTQAGGCLTLVISVLREGLFEEFPSNYTDLW